MTGAGDKNAGAGWKDSARTTISHFRPRQIEGAHLDQARLSLAHILPVPVALLAANRKSSAIGVRPRGSRLEVTADFTPDAALMLATCGFIAGSGRRCIGRITSSSKSRHTAFRSRFRSGSANIRHAAAGACCVPRCSTIHLPRIQARPSGSCAMADC